MSWTTSTRIAAEELGHPDNQNSSTGYEPNDHFITEAYVEFTQESVKSTSPDTENHYKNGYVSYNINKNFIMTNEDNSDNKYTNKKDTNNHNARELHE